MNNDPVLVIENLSVKRGRQVLIAALNLKVSAGEAVLLLGGNGLGKTTLADILCGLQPTSGRGHFRRPSHCGYAQQEPKFPRERRVASYLKDLAAISGATRSAISAWAEQALDEFALEAFAKRRIGELSRGWRQRLNLARAFLGNPQLVVLDEPQTALDPQGMEHLQRKFLEIESRHDDPYPAVVILSPPGTGCEALTARHHPLEAEA